MPYVRGFRFPAPPATLGSSLPGLKRCAHFVSLPNLIAVGKPAGFLHEGEIPTNPRYQSQINGIHGDKKWNYAVRLLRITAALKRVLP
jgi:hypothetical protein